MGNGFFSEADSRRIADLATEINAQFSKDFSVAFKDAVINNLKKQLDGNVNKNSLMQYDNATQDIKTGYLIKMGANVKSWKNRYFVAKNKADNYQIIYYEDETMRKEKGRFCCCGYQVEAFSAEEVQWYGVYGIKLTSYDDTKRQWMFRARSDPEQSDWLEVFMNACKKAKPEPIKDAVYEATFKAAFSATKAAYGYFGICFIFGTECEMLEHLTNQILSREILDDYILERSKNPPGGNAKAMVLEVHRQVQKIVRPIVTQSWFNCYNAVRVLKAPFELSVKASMRQLIQKESEIKTHLDGKIREIVLPHLPEIDNTICMPILESCFEPMLQSYEQAVEGLQGELCMLVHTVDPTVEGVRAAQAALQLAVEQGTISSNSSLAESQKLLWTMHTEDLLDLTDIFEISGLAGFDVYSNALDDLRVLTQNALYTFGMMAVPPTGSGGSSGSSGAAGDGKHSPTDGGSSRGSSPGRTDADRDREKSRTESSSSATSANTRHNAKTGSRTGTTSTTSSSGGGGGGSSRKSRSGRHKSGRGEISRSALMLALNQVVTRMCSDAVLSLRAGLVKLLLDAMEAKVQESMIMPCADVVGTAQQFVTRETQLMLNPLSLGESMVREMVEEFVQNLLGKKIMQANGRMQDLADRLCAANPVPDTC